MNFFLKNVVKYFAISTMLVLAACARVGSLDGGPKDEQPPRLDSLRSTPNFQTHFSAKKIELYFNEWLRLHDVGNEVSISPPLTKRPDIALRGKTVVFSFDTEEKLRENTTYTINFGKSIQDFTENNPVEGLQFVFSTGDKIDSLRLAGQVVDALTGQPVEKVSVFLYDSDNDSVLLKEKPYYLTRSDASGNFLFKNVRGGLFKIYAVEESGSANLRWDANERLGFFTEKVWVGDTTVKPRILRIAKQVPDFKILTTDAPRFGLVRVVFSTQPDGLLIPKTARSDAKFLLEPANDSLLVWYDLPADSISAAWSFQIGKDSVKVRPQNRADFFKNKKIAFSDVPVATQRGGRRKSDNEKPTMAAPILLKNVVLKPSNSALPLLNLPVVAIDTAKVLLFKNDTLPRTYSDFQVWVDTLSPRKLHFQLKNADSHPHKLVFLPESITDFWGGKNADTLTIRLNFIDAKQLGGLVVALEGLSAGEQFVLQVLQNNIVEAEKVFTTTNSTQRIEFQNLPAVECQLRLIKDSNRNGRWDAGNFLKGNLPETILNKKVPALKAGNWELEVKWDLEESNER